MNNTSSPRRRRVVRTRDVPRATNRVLEGGYHYRITYRNPDWSDFHGPVSRVFASRDEVVGQLWKLRQATKSRSAAIILNVERIEVAGRWQEVDL